MMVEKSFAVLHEYRQQWLPKWTKCSPLFCATVAVGILVLAASTLYVSYALNYRYLSATPRSVDLPNKQRSVKKIQEKQPYTFDDIFNLTLIPRSFSIIWIGDSLFTYRNISTGDLMEYNTVDDTQVILMPNAIFEEVMVTRYFVSPDREAVLRAYGHQKLWGFSFFAKYKIYFRNNDTGAQPEDFPRGDLAGKLLQYAGWAPVETAQKLVFVYENNIYYQGSPTDDYEQVTKTGGPNIFNGVPDYVYEDHVLRAGHAIYWSQNAMYLAYASFDVTDIPKMKWPFYGSKTDVYGQIREVARSKPGDIRDGKAGPITKVRIYVVDISDINENQTQIQPPAELEDKDHLYTRIAWRDDNHLMITWSNRVQNHSIIEICEVSPLSYQRNYELSVPNGWIDVPGLNYRFVDNGENYLTILSRDVGDSGGFAHVARVTSPVDRDGIVTFLTDGLEEVTSIVGFDPTRQLVYYITTGGDPLNRRLFRVGTPEADEADRARVCMSCDEPTDTCDYATASFSYDASYYLLHCLGPDTPTYRLRSTNGSKDIIMEDNADVRAKLAQKDIPIREFSDIDLGNGIVGKTAIYKMHNQDDVIQHPMLVYVYAGPGSQEVTRAHPFSYFSPINWLHYMASTHNVLIATVDGRGSGGRGDRMRYQTYRRLGTVEITDQVEATRHLKEALQVDKTKNVSIIGASYGGFAASHALADVNNQFQCAIAAVPVTSLTFFDTGYCERYMGLATMDDNFEGYNNSDVTNKAPKFAGKKYLLAAGSDDDLVQYMHSAHLISALTQLEIQFKNLLYVDQNHAIPRGRRHLFRAITDFLLKDCWGIPQP